METYARAAKAAVLVALLASLCACAFLQRIADRFSPRATFADLQYAAIQQNLGQTDGFTAGVGAYIGAGTLDQVLRTEVTPVLIESAADSIRFDRLEPRLVLLPQGIVLDVSLDGLELKNKVRVKGNAEFFVAVSTSGDRLLLRPTIGHLKLSKFRAESGGRVSPDVAALVNAAVKAFADNAAGYFKDKPIAVSVSWDTVLRADVSKLNSSVLSIDAENRLVQLTPVRTLTLIDRDGIRILGEVAVAQSQPHEVNFKSADMLGGGVSEATLKKVFNEYSDVFQRKWNEQLDPIALKKPIEVYISKSAVASVLNAISDQKLGLRYRYATPATSFDEVVEAKKSQVNCQDAREPFKRKRYQRRNCSWNCLKCVDLCPIGSCPTCTDDPVCLANRAQCNVVEEAKVAADNVLHEEERARHNVIQESKVAACNVWRETTAILSVGRFAGDFKTSGEARVATDGIQFDPALTYVDVKNLGVRVGGKFALDMKVTPHDLGHVFFCVAPTNLDYRGDYGVQIPGATQRIGLSQVTQNGDLVLRATIPSVKYQAVVDPAPIENFVKSPEFLAKCPIGTKVMLTGLAGAGIASRLGLKQATVVYDAALGRYSGVQELGAIEYRVTPQRIRLTEQSEITVYPATGAKSIQLQVAPIE